MTPLPEYSPYAPAVRPEDGFSDMYGALYWAASYAGIQLPDKYYVRSIWQHGCFAPWFNCFGPGLLTYRAPGAKHLPVLVGTKSQAALLRDSGFSQPRAIGSPINYADCADIERRKGSLLVMPTHTLPFDTYNDRTSFRQYAAEIKSIAHHFNEVVVCVHPSCLRSGFWVDEFKQYGFLVVFGAGTDDRNALVRMRNLFLQFDVVTTNGWGSHVAYALADGARVSIWGTVLPVTPDNLRRDTTWKQDEAAITLAFSDEYREIERGHLASFLVPPHKAVANVELGKAWIGADNKITPAEMRDLLELMIDPSPSQFYSSGPNFSGGLQRILFVVEDARDTPWNRRLLDLLVWLRHVAHVGFDVVLIGMGPLLGEFNKYATLFSLDVIQQVRAREHTYQLVYVHGLGAAVALPLLELKVMAVVAYLFGEMNPDSDNTKQLIKFVNRHVGAVIPESLALESELIFRHGVPVSLMHKATAVEAPPSEVYAVLGALLTQAPNLNRQVYDSPDDFAEVAFSYDDRVSCLELIKDYVQTPDSAELHAAVVELQGALIDFISQTEVGKFCGYFAGNFGFIYRALVTSGLNSSGLTAEKANGFLAEAKPLYTGSGTVDLQALMIAMLRHPACWRKDWVDFTHIPTWFLDDYLKYLLSNPQVFVLANEEERYFEHLEGCARSVMSVVTSCPDSALAYKVAEYFACSANCIPLYFTRANTRFFMENRASIIEYMLIKKGAALDFSFQPRPKNRKRIKVGVISAHVGAQTETHVTLPALYLDKEQFEVCLFCIFENPGPVEVYSRSLADSFTLLPKDVHAQARVVREALLDVAIIGTNLTAVTNPVVLLALHRLAPLQLVNYCSPVSTGIRNIDGYLTGTFNDFPGIQDHFSEKLYFCDGAPGCLDYTVERQGSGELFTREKLGLSADEVVFINAAACYKILPEMQELWAEIMKSVPNSRLVLLPFNPSWSNSFPVKQFERSLTEVFARHGLSRDRFILWSSLPSRADVKELEKIADVYLDTLPFSGSISVIDPLEVGLPVVVNEGGTHRSRMAASLLRAIDLPELITSSRDEYVQLAVKLGLDGDYRVQLRDRILATMAASPKFINPREYARDLGRVILRNLNLVPRVP